MKQWQNVLEGERRAAAAVYNLGCGRDYHLGYYYRGKYWLEHVSPEPRALQHARAFAAMLEQLPTTAHPEQEFFGGVECAQLFELPSGIDRDNYFWYHGVACGHGLRNFTVGNDHTVADYRTLLKEGFGGMLRRIAESRRHHSSSARLVQLDAMEVAVNALIAYLRRAAQALQAEQPEMAARLERIATEAPKSFADALQLVWIVFVALAAEGRYHMALGRIDQYLIDFYRRDIAANVLTREQAQEYLCHIWAKIEGFHEVTNICIGGLTPEGGDAVNELSYLALEATRLVRSPSTNLSARFHAGSSDEFQLACIDVIRTGIGFPAIFNDDVTIPMLRKLHVPAEVARDYCMVGCVETLLSGRQQAWSDGRFDLHLTADKIFDRLAEFKNFDALWRAFEQQVDADLKKYVDNYNTTLDAYPPAQFPDPVLSAFTFDCIGRARDLNDGGAQFKRYHGVGMMGLGTITDSMAAVRKLVFEEKKIKPETLVQALAANFEGFESLRQQLLHDAPKYGNDDDYADGTAVRIVELCGRLMARYRTGDGGRFLSCMATNISNIPAGQMMKASPDGRLAWTPLSDAASPYYGRDMHGPTAFVSSICKPDYRLQNCTVVNMRFMPDFFSGEEGRQRFLAFTREFIRRGGHEMQFNVTDNATLEAALRDPEHFGDLVVRVSGFSAYFTRLEPVVQQDIMRRLAHE